MFAYITPMRLHGKALDQHQIRTAQAVRGDIVIAHENVTALGRHSEVASIGGGHVSEAFLPPLYDCRLAYMGTGGFVLSGLELVGSIAYAQSWWCRPD